MKLGLALLLATSLYADGGKVLFQRKAGAFNITLFAAESPVRVGRPDLSVMVQSNSDQSPVLDANVQLRLVRHDANAITDITAPAKHDQATNKLLYAASLEVNTPDTIGPKSLSRRKAKARLLPETWMFWAPNHRYWPTGPISLRCRL